MSRSAHIQDERLVAVCVERVATAAEDAHFATCDGCRAKRGRLEAMLHDVTSAVTHEADTAFPDERLATQQARILQRIEQDGRPARVIAFPAFQVPDFRPLRSRPAGRWIAGAAAAGLAIGLLAGHLAHDLPSFGPSAGRQNARVAAPHQVAASPTLSAVTVSLNEDEFLGELESALEGPELASLRSLNDLTPQ